mmetsp:Transcript_8859/g.36181  ORF Transcript_8859/g.36181 Transcript_8859/m.36181 type:complete len:220 (-) Transcript_8859:231-890(-)
MWYRHVMARVARSMAGAPLQLEQRAAAGAQRPGLRAPRAHGATVVRQREPQSSKSGLIAVPAYRGPRAPRVVLARPPARRPAPLPRASPRPRHTAARSCPCERAATTSGRTPRSCRARTEPFSQQRRRPVRAPATVSAPCGTASHGCKAPPLRTTGPRRPAWSRTHTAAFRAGSAGEAAAADAAAAATRSNPAKKARARRQTARQPTGTRTSSTGCPPS